MSTTFAGTYFDGKNLRAHAVTVTIVAGMLRLDGLLAPVEVSCANVQISDRLAQVPRFLQLPDGGSLETDDNVALDRYLASRRHQRGIALIHWLEQRSRIAALAALLLVLSVGGAVFFGLPVLAQKAAMKVPASIEKQAGQAALRTLDRFFKPSELSQEERIRVFKQFQRLPVPVEHKNVQFEFRGMHSQPNAFALPGNIIVVSDELVRMGLSDEIAAVLAHEVAHLHYRHGLQNVLSSSAALLLLSVVTGDLSTLSTFTAALPLTLLQNGYSRKFELEADAYAVALLKKASINPAQLSSILEKLEASRPVKQQGADYFSTHPATAERVKRIGLGKAQLPTPPDTSQSRPLTVAQEEYAPKPILTITPGPGDEGKSVQELIDSHRPLLKTGITEPPKPIFQPGPAYPQKMSGAGIEGSVVVEFIIDTEGKVRSCTIVRSSHVEFEAPALETVRSWRFEPGRAGDKKVSVLVSQQLDFKLEESPSSVFGSPHNK